MNMKKAATASAVRIMVVSGIRMSGRGLSMSMTSEDHGRQASSVRTP